MVKFTQSELLFQCHSLVLIAEEKPVTIEDHDSHHNTMSRLVAFAKVTYHSDFKQKWKPYKYIL